jgi:uncharacterized protein
MRREFVTSHVTAHVLTDPRLGGYRIAVMGDFHIAPWQGTGRLHRACDAVRALNPDCIALVGDYGHSIRRLPRLSRDWYRKTLPAITDNLARLTARDGVVAVLGNHDSDAGAELVDQALSAIGIRVLRDRWLDVQRENATLRILGLDDASLRGCSRGSVPARWDDAPAVTLVLTHHPDRIDDCALLAREGPVIAVAGHTHGGQIVLPRLGAPLTLSRVATHRFPGGFVPNEVASLYVTRGIGEQIPLRVAASREIALIELAPR